MSNQVQNPGFLIGRVAVDVFFILVCLFVMNLGLGMINEANDTQFYLGLLLTVAPLGVLAYAGSRLYNHLVGFAPTTKGN